MNKVQEFLKRKNIIISGKRYGIDALGAMAQGLFCSLLIGTIIKTLGEQAGIPFLVDVGNYASAMSGAAMAVAIGFALQAPPMVLFSLATVGYAANALGSTSLIPDQAGAGGPLAVLFIAVIAAEFGKAVSKETKVDILVTPLVTILVGVALTLPISSAAICAAFGLTGLAGGAAVAGCCANMVGFAVLSFRENRWGGLVSQGLGTSMLQMGNIVKNPRIWLPAIVTSAITGPIATCVFRLEMNGPPVSSGMGTCGLVAQIGVWTGWLAPSERALANGAAAIVPGVMDWLGLILISFVLPAVLCWAFGGWMRKIGWIKEGDLTLQ